MNNRILVATGAAFAGLRIFAAIMLTMSAVAATGPDTPERAVSAAPAQTLQSEAQVSRDLVEFELKNNASVPGAFTAGAASIDGTALVGWSACISELYYKTVPWWARAGYNLQVTIQCTFF